MSNKLYTDLDNNFPIAIDNFDKFLDPSASLMTAIQLYKSYYAQGNIVAAVGVLEQNPDLKRCIINAENLNQLRDAIISLERYYMNDIHSYLMNLVQWRGAWNALTAYEKYQVVSYTRNESTVIYMALANQVPVGILPTQTDYWIPITLRGERGVSGTGLSGRGNWSRTTEYYEDDWVVHNNTVWASRTTNTNSEPHDNSADWYAVIRDQQHYVISEKEPTTQYAGDIWYKLLPDGAIEPLYKQPDGTYTKIILSDATKVVDLTYELTADDWTAVSGYEEVYQKTVTDYLLTSLVGAHKTRIDIASDVAVKIALEEMGVNEIWCENRNGTLVFMSRGEKLSEAVSLQLTFVNAKQ